MPLIKDYPALGASLKPQPRQVSFADGDSISIVQPIRMLSCDTPEKEGFAGRAETVQPHLDRCAERLRGDFYAAIPGPMREHVLERLEGEAAVRHLRAGHGASGRFEILLAERLTLPDVPSDVWL
jgi:hypothetical protein